MMCPRGCGKEAVDHRLLGVMPCLSCQAKDAKITPHRKFEFANLSKLDRVQEQRDHHMGDLLQPYDGQKANPDFFKQYPDRVDDYGVREELAKL